jgi:hypothetical protein
MVPQSSVKSARASNGQYIGATILQTQSLLYKASLEASRQLRYPQEIEYLASLQR